MLAYKENIVIDRAIGPPGHGKSEVDAINGVDKNTIYREAMKTVKSPDEVSKAESHHLQTFTVNNVKGEKQYSAALNCKHVLESKGAEGVKSEGKSAKRERERGINRRHWHVRDVKEKLSDVKCATIKNFSDSCTFSDMYHYYVCPQLGPGKAALRRFPCNCPACDEVITKPWTNAIKDPVLQPRFQNPDNCFFKPLFGDENKWHFVELKERSGTDEDEVDEEREVVLKHVTTSVARSIEVGKIGAFAFAQGKEEESEDEEYCLVEFVGLPRTDQGDGTTGGNCAWKVDCHWLIGVPTARHWYTKSSEKETVDLVHVVATDVEMEPMSPTNMMRNRAVRKEAAEKKAMRISDESHEFILDEIRRRERLEYDPSRVFVEAVDGSESEEDEEDLV